MCIQKQVTGLLLEVNGRINASDYLKLLQYNLNVDEIEQNWVIFQHDNATIYKPVIVSNWLAQQHFQVLQWSLQSPDLNPIENVSAEWKPN